ncbi:universal stress protein [Salinicola avicenniae]|uniref:universal stress protein n=1 Tax=Salinicola avicenniae TaxID=2916836 RepID=UPI002072C695|nr:MULTISPECIES: universal stress protein [unclassified Salinicola]
MFKSLLIPIDGSEDSHVALNVACQLAAPIQGKLHLLHVRDPYPQLHRGEMLSVEAAIKAASVETAFAEGRKVLDRALDTLPSFPGYNGEFDTHIKQGSPAKTIVAEAERLKVDAIVMGSRGLGQFKGLMIGSVSHKVTHVANCRVICVHEKPREHATQAPHEFVDFD